MSSSPKFSVSRTIKSKLSSVPIIEGQIIFLTDTLEIYFDNSDSERIQYSDLIILANDDERNNILIPLENKIYYVKSTNALFAYHSQEWQILNASSIEIEVTETNNGIMLAADKRKLNSIEEGANKTVVDSELSSTSTNPVQNDIVTNAINDIRSTSIKEVLTVSSNGETLLSLTQTPKSNVLILINGIGYTQNDDYTIADKTVTWVATAAEGGFDLETTDIVEAQYEY